MVNDTIDLDAVFQALANPARRTILDHLARGEAAVGELARPLRMTAPAVSRHLRVLEGAGLIERQRDGRVHRIRMNGSPMARAGQWLQQRAAHWADALDRLDGILEEERDGG